MGPCGGGNPSEARATTPASLSAAKASITSPKRSDGSHQDPQPEVWGLLGHTARSAEPEQRRCESIEQRKATTAKPRRRAMAGTAISGAGRGMLFCAKTCFQAQKRRLRRKRASVLFENGVVDRTRTGDLLGHNQTR